MQRTIDEPIHVPRYRAADEHDACGVGFVADLRGGNAERLMPLALEALARLEHRGGRAADGRTGDGAVGMSARMLYQRRGSCDSSSTSFVCSWYRCATRRGYSSRAGPAALRREIGMESVCVETPIGQAHESRQELVERLDRAGGARRGLDIREDPLNRRAMHGLVGVSVDQFPGQVVKAPACGRALMLGSALGGEVDDFQACVGGKRPAGARSGGHPGARPSRVGGTGYATRQRCCDCSRIRRRPRRWSSPWRTASSAVARAQPRVMAASRSVPSTATLRPMVTL